MRASTACAILSLAAGVASSVALPLPAMKSGGAGVSINKRRALSPHTPPNALPHASPDTPVTPPPIETTALRPWHSEPPSFQPLPPSVTQPTPNVLLHAPPNTPASPPPPLPPVLFSTSRPPSEPQGSPPSPLSPIPGMTLKNLHTPESQRALPDHVDRRIKLAARAYVRELLKASIDDLE